MAPAWVLLAQGGDAFPLSYGDFDNVAPRWSPDGTRIAFVPIAAVILRCGRRQFPAAPRPRSSRKRKHHLKPVGS